VIVPLQEAIQLFQHPFQTGFLKKIGFPAAKTGLSNECVSSYIKVDGRDKTKRRARRMAGWRTADKSDRPDNILDNSDNNLV
jgi:hypothetical protein